jgi:hypothetical protein
MRAASDIPTRYWQGRSTVVFRGRSRAIRYPTWTCSSSQCLTLGPVSRQVSLRGLAQDKGKTTDYLEQDVPLDASPGFSLDATGPVGRLPPIHRETSFEDRAGSQNDDSTCSWSLLLRFWASNDRRIYILHQLILAIVNLYRG